MRAEKEIEDGRMNGWTDRHDKANHFYCSTNALNYTKLRG